MEKCAERKHPRITITGFFAATSMTIIFIEGLRKAIKGFVKSAKELKEVE